MARARELGITVKDLSSTWGCDVVRYRRGDREALVFVGQQFPSLTAHGASLCDHKHACKAVLRDLGLPVPDGLFFFDPAHVRAELEALLGRHGRLVVKPVDGTHGDGVRTGLDSLDAIEAHWRSIKDNPGGYLAEEQVGGQDLRLQAVGGRLVAACRREPASVLGDGVSTIRELAAARDAACRAQNPLNRLILDEDSQTLLARQNLGADSVPREGHRVRLKFLSNISMGGEPVDVTDILHPDWVTAVADIGEALGLRIFSVDVFTLDPSAGTEMGHVIEVNARPEWLHHTFSRGRQHDIPRLILEDILG